MVEYQLLLMKYAGVDGVSLDWPGTTALWDFPDNKLNTEAYIQRLNDFGLNFLIVNEDRNYQSGVVPVERAGTMARAVELAEESARPGDTVLLAPACASFDQFESYEHRGRVFKQLVRSLAEKNAADEPARRS